MNFIDPDQVIDRPHARGCGITTPKSEWVLDLLGSGIVHEGMALTKTETENINKLYGFTKEPPAERPARPKPNYTNAEGKALVGYELQRAKDAHERAIKAWENWKDPISLVQAGANRNVMRHVSHDGVRLVAWIAKYCEPNQDPLKVLIQMAIDGGFDVDPEDVSFAEGEEPEGEEPDAE